MNARGIAFARLDRNAAKMPDDFDSVVHFGGITPVSAAPRAAYADYHRANVEGTKRLLDVLANRKLKRLVNIGSAAEYGVSPRPFREGAAEKPVTSFGKSKLAQSRLIEAFAAKTGVPTLNLRVFNIAGLRARRAPGESSHAPTVFDSIIEQLEKGPRVAVSNGRIVRDFVDLTDIAQAVLRALEAKTRGYELVNISSGHGTSLADLARAVGRLLGREPRVVDLAKTADISIGDPAKAAKLLGWKARIGLEESIARMVGTRTRVMIVGAGMAGRAVARELTKAGRRGVVVAGLVDDDPKKQGMKVGEARVAGKLEELPRLVDELAITQVLISTPSAGASVAMRTAELLPPGFPIRILPSATSVLLGGVHLSQVRDIDPSDLVGRPLVKTDQKFTAQHAKGKTFLVTGAAGSIGSEIVRQLCGSGAGKVVIFDSWEEGIFNLVHELRLASVATPTRLIACLGNIRDRARLDEIFRQYKFDAVIHAAAYKHVPLLEENRTEAWKTNVDGTRNVLAMVARHKVPDFVLISTDKAVRPAGVLGETKRAAELLLKTYARKHRSNRFIAVRFGNVLNSSGSVIPTFLRQIRSRQPVTITHPEVTRYFMSIPEAVSLVLQSWIIGKSGQIFLLDMGEPSSILELALRLIRLHGLEPYRDIDIKVIGLRPGEKLHEELSYDPDLKPSAIERIYIAEDAGAR